MSPRLKVCQWTLVLAACAYAGEKTASQLYKQGRKAERAGNEAQAFVLYTAAAAQDPSLPQIWSRLNAVRPVPPPGSNQAPSATSPVIAAPVQPTPLVTPNALSPVPPPGTNGGTPLGEAPLANPASPAVPGGLAASPQTPETGVLGTITDRDIAEARVLLPPPTLKSTATAQDLDLRGNSQEIFERIASLYGLRVVFDSGYQPKPGLRVRLTESDFREALRAAEATSESFVIPINAKLLLVANDTAQKRTELDKTAAVVHPAPEPFTVQEIQEIATAIRGTLDIQRLMVDTQRRLILIRDRISKVRMAEKLIDDLMRPKPQVAIDVELLASDQTSSMTYGLSLPSSVPLVWFGKGASLTSDFPAGFMNYLGFGGGKSFLGLGVTDASLFANATKSNSTTLLKSELVTSDGQAASLHVGDKYPILTAGYFGAVPSNGQQTYTPPPTFNFEDLGLILKITPHVHGMEEVSLDIDAEFKLLGNTVLDGIPIISNRKLQSKVRVTTGEWAVLAGLMTDSDGTTISGIPGLSLIPFMRKNDRNRSHGETLVVLKPRLLNLPPTESATHGAWIGTETKPRTAL